MSPSSGGRADLFLGARDGLDDDFPRLGGVAPFANPHPFFGLEVLIVGEEMLDLLKHDRGQVLTFADVRIIRKGRIDGHADQLFVASMLVLKIENSDWPVTNEQPRTDG